MERWARNKNTIKIIGEETELECARLFRAYDSKKSGAVDHLAPALQQAADPLDVVDFSGKLRGLPSVQLHGASRRSEDEKLSLVRSSCSTVRSVLKRFGTIFRVRPKTRSFRRNCAST